MSDTEIFKWNSNAMYQPQDVAATIRQLNACIDCLYSLDVAERTGVDWGSADIEDALPKLEFGDIAGTMEVYRAILLADVLDYKAISKILDECIANMEEKK